MDNERQCQQIRVPAKEEIFVGIQNRNMRGFKGIQLLRRELGEEVEFVTIMTFDSLDAVREFAGEDYEVAVVVEIFHLQDGTSALDFLFRRNDSHDRDASLRPQLILLDLHLPDIGGIEILRTIKAADELRAIPVVMLTTSATDGEIARAYSNHANSYLVKPIGGNELKELIHVLCSYWFGKNRSPKICVAIDEVQHAPIAPQLRRGNYQTKTASTV